MSITQKKSPDIVAQIGHFLLHLRWHYQLFILSGGFLLGGFLSNELNLSSFIIQFLNVHLLLFGGATAYNSYWDKDEGPIGGLKNPPRMQPWMLPASLAIQAIGLIIAFKGGMLFAGIYAFSMFFFWLYSSPALRWKGHPIKSLFAIGLSTGFSPVLMGFLAAGNSSLGLPVVITAAGTAFIILSLYPLSQIYQQTEDRKRGDITFAIRYGVIGVKRFYTVSFLAGLFMITIILTLDHSLLSIIFGVIGLAIVYIIRARLIKLDDVKNGYQEVMKIKYSTSLAFVCFLIVAIVIKH